MTIALFALAATTASAYHHRRYYDPSPYLAAYDPVADELLDTRAELLNLQKQLLHERLAAKRLHHEAAAPPPAPPTPPRVAPQPTTHQHQPCYLCSFLSVFLFAKLLSAAFGAVAGGCSNSNAARGCPLAYVGGSLLFFYVASHFVGFALSVLSGVLIFAGSTLFFLLHSGLFILFLPLLAFTLTRSSSSCNTSGATSSQPCVFKFFRCRPRASHCSAPQRAAQGDVLPAAGLSKGATGPGVAQLQEILIQMGRMSPAAVRYGMGFYGPFTTKAVAALQAELKTAPTGVYDEAVRQYLMAQLGAPAPKPQEEQAKPDTTKHAVTTPQEASEAAVPAEAAEAAAPAPAVKLVATLESPAVPETEPVVEARTVLLREMGFSEQQIAGALEATHGSLERAADWLYLQHADAQQEREEEQAEEEAFPVEWSGLLRDLQDMGFEEPEAKAALKQANGEMKDAVKALVAAQREAQA